MEIITNIFKIIAGIGILLFVGYIMSFITGGISKLFGTTSTLNGRIVSTPDTLDENIRELKELKNNFISAVKKFKSQHIGSTQLGVSEQIKLISQLESLRDKKLIDEIEYETLKKKIISKT